MQSARSSREGAYGYSRGPVTDLVVATPVFLDLTFAGLESLPALGEERFAAELLRSPGGGAITAVAAAPLGDDVAGDLVRSALSGEQVEVIMTRSASRTPTTVVLPVGGDRAMVTVDPGIRASAVDIVARAPTAVAANLDLLHVVPAGVRAYITCGDDEARAYAGRPPAALADTRALFVNRTEALALTGEVTVDRAAARLGALVETV